MNIINFYEKKLYKGKCFFHITHKNNLNSIAKSGLVPKNGTRSKSIHDDRQAVFLFPDLSYTLCWCSQLYPENELDDLALLIISTKEKLHTDMVGNSLYSLETIPPKNIYIIENIFLPSSKITFSLSTYDAITSKLLRANHNVMDKNMFLFDKALEEGIISIASMREFSNTDTKVQM